MLEDNSTIADECGASARAASVEPQIEPTRTLSSHKKEEPKTLSYVDTITALEPPPEPLNPPASPDKAPPRIYFSKSLAKSTTE